MNAKTFENISEEAKIVILKELWEAIRLEMTGHTFYSSMYEKTQNAEAQALIKWLAEEEKRHQHMLEELYHGLKNQNQWRSEELQKITENLDQMDHPVFTEAMKKNSQNDTVLLSVLANGQLLEKNARNFYADAAEKTVYPEVKEFYTMMVKWEEEHFNLLADMEKSLQEDYWSDQGFWPF